MITRIELYDKIFTYLMDKGVIPLDARAEIHSIMYANGYAIDGDKIIQLQPLRIKEGNWYLCIKENPCGFKQGELYYCEKPNMLRLTSDRVYNVLGLESCFMLTNKSDLPMAVKCNGCELQDNEHDDENIRNEIIKFIATTPEAKDFHGKYIAWLEKQGEQKPTDLRTWKYIVDAVLTEREGIGQYLDDSRTETIAKKLQERFGSIEKEIVDSRISNSHNGKEYGEALHNLDIVATLVSNWKDEPSRTTEDGKLIMDNDAVELLIKTNRLFKSFDIADWNQAYQKGLKNGEIYGRNKTMKELEQKPVEWSEEDENHRKDAILAIQEYRADCIKKYGKDPAWADCVDWLKSLRPQKQWKPNEEQMQLIGALSKYDTIDSYNKEVLKGFYEELKAL